MEGEQQTSRRKVLGMGLVLGLAACGGGGDGTGTGPAPLIDRLEANDAHMGERVRLMATFSGGQGRIEPDIGPVTSGVAVQTPPLSAPRRYTLIVDAPGHTPARRELELSPAYRDRYVALHDSPWLQYHAALATPDGGALIIGGSRGLTSSSEAIDRFDPVTRRISRVGSMYTGRSLHTATELPSGQALVVGGTVGLSSGGFAETVDLRTGSVEPAGWPVRTRIRHAAVALADGRVLIVGGWQRDTVELWDPATRRFRLVTARMHNVREFPSATRLADGRVLIVGGDHTGPIHRLAEVFDPRTETFEPVASPLDAERRAMHAAHALADGRVLVLGGELRTEAALLPLDTVLMFDSATGTLVSQTALDTPRSLVRSLLLPDGQVRLFGGHTAAEPSARSASVYAPGKAPRALAPMPAGRSWHTVTALADGRVLILGGDDAAGDPVAGGLLYE